MDKRFLIKYLYKGKQVTVAWSEAHAKINKFFLIGNKLTIGSDPSLLWQIFNPTFPKRHDLIIKENQNYYFNLLKSFSIKVNKDGKELSLEELKSLGLLKDNRLYMKDDYSGSIIIDDNTTITFDPKPKPAPLTDEQKKFIALLNRWPKITTQQRITKYVIILVILLIMILASVVGWTYTPPAKENIFSLAEKELTVAIPIKATTVATEEPEFYDDVEYSDEGELEDADVSEQKEAQDKVQDEAAIRQRAARRAAQRTATTSSAQRYSRTSGSIGGQGGSGLGTGGALGVKSRVRGLRGTSRENSSFTNIEVDTGSEYGEISKSLGRQKDDQLNTAAVSARGVKADQVRGRKTASIGSDGSADLGTLASNIGDGYAVKTIEGEDVDGTSLETGQVEVRKRVIKNLTDPEKKNQIEEWFMTSILPRINIEFDSYKLRKSIRGELAITLIFKGDKIVRANIRGKGSINDREFISKIQRLIEGRTYPNIGDFTITITQNFE